MTRVLITVVLTILIAIEIGVFAAVKAKNGEETKYEQNNKL